MRAIPRPLTVLVALVRSGVVLMAAVVSAASAQGPTPTPTPASVFNDAKAYGSAAAQTARGGVSNNVGSSIVPNFTYTSPEGGLFGAGQGSLGGPAAAKLSNCQGTLPNDAYTAQECLAINYIRGLPTGFSINGQGADTTAVTTASKDIIINPGSYNGTPTGTYCKTVTRTSPAKYVTETCNSVAETTFPKCTRTREIGVTWAYECPANAIGGPKQIPAIPPYPPQYICKIPQVTTTISCKPPYIGQPIPQIDGSFQCLHPDGSYGPATISTFQETETVPYCPFPLEGDPILQIDGSYQCLNSIDGSFQAAQTHVVPKTKTITKVAVGDTYDFWTGDCEEYEVKADDTVTKPPTCELQKSVCSVGPQTRTFFSIPVTRDCWEYQKDFACIGPNVFKECESIAGKQCTYNNERCLEYTNQTNLCAIYTKSYNCLSAPGQTQTATVCDSATFCDASVGNQCFDTKNPVDTDFALAAGMMEAQREAGVYLKNLKLFNGTRGTCSVKVLGGSTIKSCCKGQPGAASFKNSAVLNAGISVGMTVLGEAGKETLRAGTQFAYDSLYQSVDGTFLQKGLEAARDFGAGIGDGIFNPSFSFYGFTFTFDFTNGFQFTGFDPVSFAIAVGLQLINQWLQCDQKDQMTMIKKGGNLCTFTEEYCSKRLPIIRTCIEKTEGYCCFNSVLAKIINRQGGLQIGRSRLDCSGFSDDEFAQIDFASMNFSEFLAEINNPGDPSALMTSRNAAGAARLITNYYNTGSQRN
jgi:conjugal transfer mating pair stabilization protein TraN